MEVDSPILKRKHTPDSNNVIKRQKLEDIIINSNIASAKRKRDNSTDEEGDNESFRLFKRKK